ncbi:uncharacterized protein LOC122788364 [Protopterus annectens]|uniref:uncharacterized protein LOC122788364 n=1 Tax=Protopterus annectens TaxID=7888 RepID=UPI001CF9B1AB|nr:uncharacterized protein LOC122788364 [Protopterus annectens]
MTWYKNKINVKNQLSLVQSAPYLNIWHCVRYHQESGIRIRIAQAFGTVKGLYVNAFARIIKGTESKNLPELTGQGGEDEKIFTCKLDLTSLQKSPQWTDPSTLLHPYLDTYTVLLVQLLSLDAVYTRDPSGQRPGQVTSRSGNALQLTAKGRLTWTVIPLFDGKYVRNGQHRAPLFEGIPSPEFLDYIRSHPVKDAFVDGIQKKALKISKNYGSLTVEVWDGHYFDEEHYTLPDAIHLFHNAYCL